MIKQFVINLRYKVSGKYPMLKLRYLFFIFLFSISKQVLSVDDDVDRNFTPDVGFPIFSMEIQSDEKVLIGGSFNRVNGVLHPKFARLNSNGTVDTEFKVQGGIKTDSGVNNIVRSIAIQSDDYILIAGQFTEVADISRNRIARLRPNGELDPSFNPNVDGNILVVNLDWW